MHTESASDHTPRDEGRRRFRACFPGHKRVFLPVIYASSEMQALGNVDAARQADTDGVFLINHGIDGHRLLQITENVIARHPDLFVGVSCLGWRPQDAIRRAPAGITGVMASYATWAEAAEDAATAIRQAREAGGWDGLFLAAVTAGAATDERALSAEVAAAAAHIDIPTIIGDPSRSESDIRGCRKLRQTLSDHPLGIAASISSATIDELLPYFNCIMTTARANTDLEHMDLQEAKRLTSRIHAYPDKANVGEQPPHR